MKMNILNVAEKMNFTKEDLIPYGYDKCKINKQPDFSTNVNDGKLILVTALNPTKSGEGKTTISIGLADALNKTGHKTCLSLREPSLGPVFGLKGTAVGGGKSKVIPENDISLHFTGDIHAITSAQNLLCALVDNYMYQESNSDNDIVNFYHLNPETIKVKRCLDMNDRNLREVLTGLGKRTNGIPRKTNFTISTASEIMAILCLSKNISDLKNKIGNILIGFTYTNEPVRVKDLGFQDAIASLLVDAIKPNLVQTLEETPAIIHGGPFANIAHGTSSILGTKLALENSDYVVTEAGFGADLGCEKFIDIVSDQLNHKPDGIVLVVTAKAIEQDGFSNLEKNVEILKQLKIPFIISINQFENDSEQTLNEIESKCKELEIEYSFTTTFKNGSDGGIDLANKVVDMIDNKKSNYSDKFYLKHNLFVDKLDLLIRRVYLPGFKNKVDITYTDEVEKQLEELRKLDLLDNLPICVAKSPMLSENEKNYKDIKEFKFKITNLSYSAAGFLVVQTDSVLTMPGLPGKPNALNIKVDDSGEITGLK